MKGFWRATSSAKSLAPSALVAATMLAGVGAAATAFTTAAFAWTLVRSAACFWAKATDWGCARLKLSAVVPGDVDVLQIVEVASAWLSTTGFTVLITMGRKMNEIPTTTRRIHPHRASPVATRAGFLDSMVSVYPAIHGAKANDRKTASRA